MARDMLADDAPALVIPVISAALAKFPTPQRAQALRCAYDAAKRGGAVVEPPF